MGHLEYTHVLFLDCEVSELCHSGYLSGWIVFESTFCRLTPGRWKVCIMYRWSNWISKKQYHPTFIDKLKKILGRSYKSHILINVTEFFFLLILSVLLKKQYIYTMYVCKYRKEILYWFLIYNWHFKIIMTS